MTAPDGLPPILADRWLVARRYLDANGLTRPVYTSFSPVTHASARAAALVTRGGVPASEAPEPTAHDLAVESLKRACGIKERVA